MLWQMGLTGREADVETVIIARFITLSQLHFLYKHTPDSAPEVGGFCDEARQRI